MHTLQNKEAKLHWNQLIWFQKLNINAHTIRAAASNQSCHRWLTDSEWTCPSVHFTISQNPILGIRLGNVLLLRNWAMHLAFNLLLSRNPSVFDICPKLSSLEHMIQLLSKLQDQQGIVNWKRFLFQNHTQHGVKMKIRFKKPNSATQRASNKKDICWTRTTSRWWSDVSSIINNHKLRLGRSMYPVNG